jgi:tetratricopeptide (TPR) repeat protein
MRLFVSALVFYFSIFISDLLHREAVALEENEAKVVIENGNQALVFVRLSNQLIKNGKAAEAAELLGNALKLELAEQPEENANAFVLLLYLARVQSNYLRLDSAIETYARAADYIQKGPGWLEAGTLRFDKNKVLPGLYREAGRYATSLLQFDEADRFFGNLIAFYEENYGSKSPALAEQYIEWVQWRPFTDGVKRHEKAYANALAIYRASYGERHKDTLRTYLKRAIIHSQPVAIHEIPREVIENNFRDAWSAILSKEQQPSRMFNDIIGYLFLYSHNLGEFGLFDQLVAKDVMDRKATQKKSGNGVCPDDTGQRLLEGKVSTSFDINAEGVPENIQILASEPSGVFDENIVADIAANLYVPAIKAGKRVSYRIEQRTFEVKCEYFD